MLGVVEAPECTETPRPRRLLGSGGWSWPSLSGASESLLGLRRGGGTQWLCQPPRLPRAPLVPSSLLDPAPISSIPACRNQLKVHILLWWLMGAQGLMGACTEWGPGSPAL